MDLVGQLYLFNPVLNNVTAEFCSLSYYITLLYDVSIMDQAHLARQILELFPQFKLFLRSEGKQLKETQPSIPQMATLGAIMRGVNTVGKLTQLHGVSQPAVSRIIDGMVKKGWIDRLPNSTDRRLIELKLSVNGQKYFERRRARILKALEGRLADFSQSNIQQLIHGVELLSQVLSETKTKGIEK